MNIIAAVDLKNGIGKDGGLLCHIPSDLKYFKEKTLGKTVIMGRKTLLSLPRSAPLAGRRNIILTKTLDKIEETSKNATAEICHDENMLDSLLTEEEKKDAFIIGGAAIYTLLLDRAEKLYITHILSDLSADVFFPEISEKQWKETERSETLTENGISFYFSVYERI